MIKELLNIELKDLPMEGLGVSIIKKHAVKTSDDESFLACNYLVILIKSGQFKIKLNEIRQELWAQDLIIIPKGSFCTLYELQGNLHLLLLSFTSEFVFENCLKKELIESFFALLKNPLFTVSLTEKDFSVLTHIYKLIYYINKETQNQCQNIEIQRISFNLFLYELKIIFGKYAPAVLEKFSRKQELTIQFLTMLTIHCKKQHGVKFYAEALFVTSNYLNKTVKPITGKTVKGLINQSIIDEVQNLLENSKSSIAFIAQDFEFSSLSNFSAFFRKHTSISPSAYRTTTIRKM